MAKSEKEYVQLVTPIGAAQFPKLNTPETEVNGQTLDKPRYSVQLVLNEDDDGVAEFKERLESLHADAVAQADAARKKDPKRSKKPLVVNETIKPATDAEGNEIEGSFVITAKTVAVDREGNEKKIVMFDAKGKRIEANVGRGSLLKLSLAAGPYDSNLGAGLSLYLNAVQVIELKEYRGGSASGYGFGEEEGYNSEQGDEGSKVFEENTEEADEPEVDEEPAPKKSSKAPAKAPAKAAPKGKPSKGKKADF